MLNDCRLTIGEIIEYVLVSSRDLIPSIQRDASWVLYHANAPIHSAINICEF